MFVFFQPNKYSARVQVGEAFGPVRALAEGKPGELFIGTTKNAIIRAAFPDTLTPVVQVSTHRRRPTTNTDTATQSLLYSSIILQAAIEEIVFPVYGIWAWVTDQMGSSCFLYLSLNYEYRTDTNPEYRIEAHLLETSMMLSKPV